MPPTDERSWEDRLLAAGGLTTEAAQDEYLELVDGVSGTEGPNVIRALVESMRAEDDRGVYQATFRAIWRFPPSVRGRTLASALRALRWDTDRLADVLGQLAFDAEDSIEAFNLAWGERADEWGEWLLEFIVTEEEEDGWLDDDRQRGKLRPR